MEAAIIYVRDVLYMVDLGAWQVWQHLEFKRMLAEGYDGEPPDGGGTKNNGNGATGAVFLLTKELIFCSISNRKKEIRNVC